MKEKQTFDKLRRRAYMEYHQDGVLDILIGLSAIGFGLNMLTDSSALSILSWMPIIFYVPLKNRITVPRFGFVRFDSDRSRSVMVSTGILSGVLMLGLLMGIYVFTAGDKMPPSFEVFLQKNHMLVLGGLASLALVGAAAATGLKRLYAYAALTLMIIIAGIEFGIRTPYFVIAIGSIILLIGLWLLIRFLQNHPVIADDTHEA
jgi:hypothetical protein